MTPREALTRIHLRIGEALRLTRYVSCWDCEHVREIEPDPELEGEFHNYRKAVCYCWKVAEDDGDGVPLICSPSEAVWCASYKEVGE